MRWNGDRLEVLSPGASPKVFVWIVLTRWVLEQECRVRWIGSVPRTRSGVRQTTALCGELIIINETAALGIRLAVMCRVPG